MNNLQSITSPLGVSTFGSNILRVSPDIAVIVLGVETTSEVAKKAFEGTRKISSKVKKTLNRFSNVDIQTSRISLDEKRNWQTQKFLGYDATVSYRIVVRDLDSIENLIIAAINAGATRIHNVNYQTSQLKELRVKARRNAIQAARAKAETYCLEMGVELGKIIHIEDVSPDSLEHNRTHEARDYMSGAADLIEEDEAGNTINPGDIKVAGAVRAVFKIQ